jgi:putative oxidoreductase
MTTHALHHPAGHHVPEAARRALELTEQEDELARVVRERRRAQVHVAARWVLAAMFVVLGIDKIVNFRAEAATLFNLDVGDPEVALGLAAMIEIGGALLLWFGWNTRRVSAGLCVYLALLCLFVEAYFPLEIAKLYLLANAGLFCGLLMLASHGAGELSVDRHNELRTPQ